MLAPLLEEALGDELPADADVLHEPVELLEAHVAVGAVRLGGIVEAWRSAYDAWMHGRMGAWMHGRMGAWMHGRMGVWMHGRMNL